MKNPFYKQKKFWKRLVFFIVALPVLIFSLLIAIVYFKQDAIVQAQIKSVNQTFEGKIEVGESHLAPFENFPLISIKVDEVKVFENKDDTTQSILNVKDIYAGFNLWDLLSGNIIVKALTVEDGFFNIIQHTDGSLNLTNALKTADTSKSTEPLNLSIEKIALQNLDVHKLNESNNLDVETFINYANGGFETINNHIKAHVDTKFEMNIISNGDTTYVKHKHFELHTDVDFDQDKGWLVIEPSELILENADFNLEGTINTREDLDLDLKLNGTKSNFDMLIAFAPEDLIPTLKRYENAGDIYFNANVKGKSSKGNVPLVEVNFGASEAYLKNVEKAKKLEEVGFKGFFTNGNQRNLSTTQFSLKDIKAKLETGVFLASIFVQNFEEPEVDMSVDADFNLNFLADFINLDVQKIEGEVKMEMKFHDIIDLEQPEMALQSLNQSYFTELIVNDLNLSTESLPVPLEKLNVHLEMNGKRATIDEFDFKLGNSDFQANGTISNLPAIIHHTNIPVEAILNLRSAYLDIAELSGYSEKDSMGIDEQITGFKVGLRFLSSAKSIFEAKHFPMGEFFIDDLYGKFKHYPHTFHDFQADIKIDEHDLSIIDFTGFIDDSDFHFNGLVHDYDFWMGEELNGDIDLDVSLNADLFRLEDVFSYGGENYVPEDYRHEEFEKLKIHLTSALHFKKSNLTSIDLNLDLLEAKMHAHPLRLERFNGRIHYEDEHINFTKFRGKLGKSQFDIDLNYYLGENQTIKKRDNLFSLNASYLDFDELFSYDLDNGKSDSQLKREKSREEKVSAHQDVFNIYELPFPDMRFDVNINKLNYHRVKINNFRTKLRTNQEHYLFVDTLRMNIANGEVNMNGYFNGSDPENIYLKPNLELRNINMDELLFKFENFGQDELISDNLKGRLTANIQGDIKVYPDLVPDINASEIHVDVSVLNGKLLQFEPIMLLSEYLGDRDLSVVLFDTLKNHIDMYKGELKVPNMTIETSLGHFDISGTHTANDEIEYFVRIPWKLIKQEAKNKIFGKDLSEQPVEIQKKDNTKKTRYVNLKITGTTEDFSVKLGKEKIDKL